MPAFTYLDSQLKCLVVKGLLIKKKHTFLLLKNLLRRKKTQSILILPPNKLPSSFDGVCQRSLYAWSVSTHPSGISSAVEHIPNVKISASMRPLKRPINTQPMGSLLATKISSHKTSFIKYNRNACPRSVSDARANFKQFYALRSYISFMPLFVDI